LSGPTLVLMLVLVQDLVLVESKKGKK